MKSRLRNATAIIFAFIMLLCTASVAFAAEKSVDTVSARNAMIQEITGTGKIEIIRNSGSIAAAKGIRLQTGDRLKTGQNAKLYIVIDGTNVIRLDEQSEAEVSNGLFGRIKINLSAGRLFYNVTKTTSENESLDFMANNITIAVRGTSGLIGFGQGTVESMLFDGTVNIEMNGQKLVQVPAQEIFFKQEPGLAVAEAIQIKEFTVNDIPESVINEMKNDNALKDKIMKSVPISKDAAGNPVFGDVNTDLTNVGKADNTMLPYSKPAEQKTTASGGGGGSYTPSPAPEPEPEPKPEPKPTSKTCLHCGKEYDPTNSKQHESFRGYDCNPECDSTKHGNWECLWSNEDAQECLNNHQWIGYDCLCKGHGRFKCQDDPDEGNHKLVTCDCGKKYCYADKIEYAKHHELCPHCGEYYCPYVSAEKQKHNEFVGYKCNPDNSKNNHGQWKCLWTTDDDRKKEEHIIERCPEGCGRTYCVKDEEEYTKHHVLCNHCQHTYCSYIDTAKSHHNTFILYPCGCDGHGRFKCQVDPDESKHTTFKGYDCNPTNDPNKHGTLECCWTEEDNNNHVWKDFDCVKEGREIGGEGSEHGAYGCDHDFDAKEVAHSKKMYACNEHFYFHESEYDSNHEIPLENLNPCKNCETVLYSCASDEEIVFHNRGGCKGVVGFAMPPLQLNSISDETGIDIADKSEAQYTEEPESEEKNDTEDGKNNTEPPQKPVKSGETENQTPTEIVYEENDEATPEVSEELSSESDTSEEEHVESSEEEQEESPEEEQVELPEEEQVESPEEEQVESPEEEQEDSPEEKPEENEEDPKENEEEDNETN